VRSRPRRLEQGSAEDLAHPSPPPPFRKRPAALPHCDDGWPASATRSAQIGREHQRDLAVTANTYSHVLADETELHYPTCSREHTLGFEACAPQ
jgi:hypothetical protein